MNYWFPGDFVVHRRMGSGVVLSTFYSPQGPMVSVIFTYLPKGTYTVAHADHLKKGVTTPRLKKLAIEVKRNRKLFTEEDPITGVPLKLQPKRKR